MPKLRRLQDLLEGAVDRPEILRAARAQRVLRQWNEVVGPLLADKVQPDRYDHGTLWVAAVGSAWAQEIRLRQDTILERLNQLAEERSLFLQIRAGVRPARKAWKPTDRHRKDDTELPPEDPGTDLTRPE